MHRILTAILVIGSCLNLYGSASIGEYLNRTNTPDVVVTNAPVTSNTPPVVVTPPAVVKEGLIAQGDFFRPSISPDGLSVACEGPKMASVYLFTFNSGKWTGGKIVTASMQTAMRTYVVDTLNGIVSWRYGIKDGGKESCYGPGIYRNGKEQYSGPSKGAARMAMSKDGPILISKNGEYKNLDTGKLGRYNMPDSGEKFDFAISGDTWATAVNGFSKRSSYVSINGKITTVADYKAYPQQSDDLCYPSVLVNGKEVWYASVFNGRLYVQSVLDGKTRWPTAKLPVISPAVMQDRCPPRLTLLNGRVTVLFVQGGTIYRADVEGVLDGSSKPLAVCKGTYPDVSGKTMVYVDGDSLKVKQLN